MFSESGAAIYTLGVGDYFLDNIARVIESREVEYVIDVRSPPHSFLREELFPDVLEPYLFARGTRYLNLSDKLGDRPSDVSLLGHGGVIDYQRYRQRDQAQLGLDRIEAAWKMGCRVCVLGREPDPVRSHRARLVGHGLYERGLRVRHLLHQGGKLMTHEELLQFVWNVRQTIHRSHVDLDKK